MNVTDKIRITNEDNMALMARYPDKHFDLAIVDPPYGIGEAKKAGKRPKVTVKYKISDWDNSSPDKEYFTELMRVSKNQIIWGANHYISKIPIDSPCWIVWDKVRGEQDFADCELAWTSFKSSVKQFTFAWDGFRQGDMKNKEIRFHPTQKPVALYKWLLKNYATPDMKILDTHLGSGSIAIACHEYGCDLTACELDADYYEASIKRIGNHINQTNLFIGT